MQVIQAHEGQTFDRTAAEIFEGGNVWARPLATPANSQQLTFQVVQFAAGARTKPHAHTSDQLLYVVAGIGKVGNGLEEHTIATGDFVVIPAGEEHWHGAADTGSPMSHIAVTAAGSETTVLG